MQALAACCPVRQDVAPLTHALTHALKWLKRPLRTKVSAAQHKPTFLPSCAHTRPQAQAERRCWRASASLLASTEQLVPVQTAVSPWAMPPLRLDSRTRLVEEEGCESLDEHSPFTSPFHHATTGPLEAQLVLEARHCLLGLVWDPDSLFGGLAYGTRYR